MEVKGGYAWEGVMACCFCHGARAPMSYPLHQRPRL